MSIEIDLDVNVGSLSPETKQKITRYANATKLYEVETRRIYFKDGFIEEPGSRPTNIEYFDARDALKTCPEPDIKKLVHLIQIERLDEASDEASAGHIQNMYHLADNELVALGFRFQEAQDEKPITRRKRTRRRVR